MAQVSTPTRQQGGGRAWDFTPPKFMNTIMSAVLRTPLLHRAISRQILLITFTGRKSGKHFSTPVGYLREGNTVTIIVKRFRAWWKNFSLPAPVQVVIEGKRYDAIAEALTDEAVTIPILAHTVQVQPRQGQIFEIGIGADGKPNMADVEAIAPKITVVRVKLDEAVSR